MPVLDRFNIVLGLLERTNTANIWGKDAGDQFSKAEVEKCERGDKINSRWAYTLSPPMFRTD